MPVTRKTATGLFAAAALLVVAGTYCAKTPPVTVAKQQPAPTLGQRILGKINEAAGVLVARKINTRYDDTFSKYSKQYFGPSFDWRWFKAQGYAESGLDPTSRSYVGARGVMQLMPTTYREVVSQNPGMGPIDQPEWNIAAGIWYDRHLWDFWHQIPYDERTNFMFAAYNAGAGTISKALHASAAKYPDTTWANIARVAVTVHPWRYLETLGYVRHINDAYAWLSSAKVRGARAEPF
jgi:membrane-bound lytic murein transglycosylase MltF